MLTTSVRPATAADIPALEALVQSAYRGDASRVGWTTEADLLDGIRTDRVALAEIISADTDDTLVLVATDDASEDLVACCHLARCEDGIVYFGMFAVRPAAQGGGIGRRLLTAAQRVAATQWSAHTMEMTVIAQRADLIAWYERRGFAATGETRPFPYGNARFGRPKRDDLEFVVLQRALAAALLK